MSIHRGTACEHREDSHIKTDAEIGVSLPQAKKHLGYQKLEEARRDPCLEASEGAWLHRCLDFGLVPSRTVSDNKFLLFQATQFGVLCSSSPRKLSRCPLSYTFESNITGHLPVCQVLC